MDAGEFFDDLNQFYGTERYYQIAPGVVLTDGTNHVAHKHGAYWLFQDVGVTMRGYEKKDGFALIRFEKVGEGFTVKLQDADERWHELFHGEYTDFPVNEFEFFGCFQPEVGWVYMLKSEY